MLGNRLVFAAGVEETEAKKPEEKAPDMRLPGDITLGAGNRNHAEAEYCVEHHPDAHDRKYAPVGERLGQADERDL